jgi:hypothetical protein
MFVGAPRPPADWLVFLSAVHARLQGVAGRVSSSTFFGVRRARNLGPFRSIRYWSSVPSTRTPCGGSGDRGEVPVAFTSDGRLPRSTAPTVIDKCGQVLKGAWWMSWHREATKDVVACDKLREAGKRALIRRFLNEETRLG